MKTRSTTALFSVVACAAEGQKARQDDGLRIETMRMLVEFTP